MYLQHLQMLSRQESGASNPNIGVKANHATIIGVSVFSIFLATTSVILRFFCRTSKKMELKSDDWTIVIALVRLSYLLVIRSNALTAYLQIFTVGDAALYLAGKNSPIK